MATRRRPLSYIVAMRQDCMEWWIVRCQREFAGHMSRMTLFRGVSSGSYNAPAGNSLWSLLAVIAIHKVRRKVSRDRSVVAGSFVQMEDASSSSQEIPGTISEQQFESSLNEAIEFLQPHEREIVALRVQGFTVEEISERASRSCRTVERTLQRIREKLSEKLLEDCDPGHAE